MKLKKTWSVSPLTDSAYLGALEIETRKGEFHPFEIMQTPSRLVFGGACNAGFLESGFILREDGETTDETLAELLADLQTYYDDGANYVSRIICNDRM